MDSHQQPWQLAPMFIRMSFMHDELNKSIFISQKPTPPYFDTFSLSVPMCARYLHLPPQRSVAFLSCRPFLQQQTSPPKQAAVTCRPLVVTSCGGGPGSDFFGLLTYLDKVGWFCKHKRQVCTPGGCAISWVSNFACNHTALFMKWYPVWFWSGPQTSQGVCLQSVMAFGIVAQQSQITFWISQFEAETFDCPSPSVKPAQITHSRAEWNFLACCGSS